MFKNSCGIGGRRDYTKEEWIKAYRLMRVVGDLETDKVVNLDELNYMAYNRLRSRNLPDSILVSPKINLEIQKMLDEILDKPQQT